MSVNKIFSEQIRNNIEANIDDMLVKSKKRAKHVIYLKKKKKEKTFRFS